MTNLNRETRVSHHKYKAERQSLFWPKCIQSVLIGCGSNQHEGANNMANRVSSAFLVERHEMTLQNLEPCWATPAHSAMPMAKTVQVFGATSSSSRNNINDLYGRERNLIGMASNLLAMASNLMGMASP